MNETHSYNSVILVLQSGGNPRRKFATNIFGKPKCWLANFVLKCGHWVTCGGGIYYIHVPYQSVFCRRCVKNFGALNTYHYWCPPLSAMTSEMQKVWWTNSVSTHRYNSLSVAKKNKFRKSELWSTTCNRCKTYRPLAEFYGIFEIT